jgi:CDP-glucose 4,6-dehydratase
MREFYKGKKVLITGHTGFKGAWLEEILLGFGAQVIGVSLKPEGELNMFNILKLKKRGADYFVDIRNLKKLEEIFKKERPDIVFHLAAQALVRMSYEDPLKTISSNTVGTTNVLEAIRKTPSVKSAVIITTDKVYENKEWHRPYKESDPLGGFDPYSSSKAAADILTYSYIQSFFNPKAKKGTLVAIARAGNVIGGGDFAKDRLIPDMVRAVYVNGKKIILRNPGAIRPWQHVLEPLSGYLLLGKKLYEGEKEFSSAWNFGPNPKSFVSVEDVARESIKEMRKGSYKVVPDKTRHEAGILKLDISKAKALLDWRPRLSFNESLEMTLDWYKNYYEKRAGVIDFTRNQIHKFFK